MGVAFTTTAGDNKRCGTDTYLDATHNGEEDSSYKDNRWEVMLFVCGEDGRRSDMQPLVESILQLLSMIDGEMHRSNINAMKQKLCIQLNIFQLYPLP